jgi:phosphate uptake regulator
MEARKVQISGKSTFMITLPKKWAVDIGLKVGSRVSITYRDDRTLLLILPTNKPFVTRKTLSLDSVKSELKKEIKWICNSLIGCEVGEETKTKIVIYDILNILLNSRLIKG